MLTVYISLVHTVAAMDHAFMTIAFPLNVLVVAVPFLIPSIQHVLVALALLTILLVVHVGEEGNRFMIKKYPATDSLAYN
jgi:ABC-type transport system involved in cytochrome bd biosynthesis fused ATPase/permease subunit